MLLLFYVDVVNLKICFPRIMSQQTNTDKYSCGDVFTRSVHLERASKHA